MEFKISLKAINSQLFRYTLGAFKAPRNKKKLTKSEKRTVNEFHELYYRLWQEEHGTIDVSWLGYKTLKCPMDLITYQEIICEVQPDVIVECGTRFGGSGLYLANLCQLLGTGRVISIDIEQQPNLPVHSLLAYVKGSSVDPKTIEFLKPACKNQKVLVILDSDHSEKHVLEEMNLYKDFVSKDSYMIVEDSNINGHPVHKARGPGPMEAIKAFMKKNDEFEVDEERERFLLTLNPQGYLKKVV